MARIGVGIIGVQPDRSWAAVAHIPALRALADDYEIVALSTTRQESADAAAERYGVPNAFDSAEKLVACTGVDLVAVTVKVPAHLDLVETAIKAGKHVYCEWPLGNGIAEARRMADLARSSGVTAVCGMQARFSPVLAYVRDLVKQGYVGDLLSATVIARVTGWGAFVEPPSAYTFDAHDQVLFDGRLEGGAPISLHYRGGMPRGTGLLIEINGSAGDLQITAMGGHAQLLDLELKGASGDDKALAPLAVPDRYALVPVEGSAAGNVARVYRQLAIDLRDGTAISPRFDDAVRRHQMLEAIAASAESGSRKRPADF